MGQWKPFYTWGLLDDVDRLHVKRNRLVGMNYLGILDKNQLKYDTNYYE